MLKASTLLLISAACVFGDERIQRYTDGEKVTLWVNKVGPYENPQETYSYYSLPFCKVDPDKWETRWAGLGEALEGNALVKSDYNIRFKKNEETTLVCSTKLDAKVTSRFLFAFATLMVSLDKHRDTRDHRLTRVSPA
jgi:transmembrane 9 superfamily protein 3